MNHSFNVEVATDYGVEKAILLENFYFWITENKANNRNIYNGKAYTYNTSEAFAEMFPYMKARKIAELLRQMEYDGLIESIQNKGTNRVKSYTLTDKALEYYTTVHQVKEESNIQKDDSPSYQNTTMEDTEIGYCSITDNKHTDINKHISHKSKKFTPPTKDEVKKYCEENNLSIDIDRFFNYYGEDWKDRENRPVKNWKQRVRTWANNNYSRGSAIDRNGVDRVTAEDLKDINF